MQGLHLLALVNGRLQSLLRMCEFFVIVLVLWTTPEFGRMPVCRVQRPWRNHWSRMNSFEVESIEFSLYSERQIKIENGRKTKTSYMLYGVHRYTKIDLFDLFWERFK